MEILKTTKNTSLEALRFFAAISVVLYHIPFVGIGNFGVDIFFIISGYIMMLSTAENKSLTAFYLKRAIRIFPLYYLVTILVFLISVFSPDLLKNTTSNFMHLVYSLAFIPFDKNGVGHQPIIAVGWTLNYEIYFYLLFGLAMWVSSSHRAILTFFALLIGYVFFNMFDSFLKTVYGDLIVFEFGLGILLYESLLNKNTVRILTFSLVIITFLAYEQVIPNHRLFYFGFPAFLIMYVFVRAVSNRRVPDFFVLLGGSSYSVYLTHSFVIRFFDRVLKWFDVPPLGSELLVSVIVLICSVFVGYLTFTIFEKPSIKFLRNLLVK